MHALGAIEGMPQGAAGILFGVFEMGPLNVWRGFIWPYSTVAFWTANFPANVLKTVFNADWHPLLICPKFRPVARHAANMAVSVLPATP